jgi:hypothetical protein
LSDEKIKIEESYRYLQRKYEEDLKKKLDSNNGADYDKMIADLKIQVKSLTRDCEKFKRDYNMAVEVQKKKENEVDELIKDVLRLQAQVSQRNRNY